jgi:hypothetical protein
MADVHTDAQSEDAPICVRTSVNADASYSDVFELPKIQFRFVTSVTSVDATLF